MLSYGILLPDPIERYSEAPARAIAFPRPPPGLPYWCLLGIRPIEDLSLVEDLNRKPIYGGYLVVAYRGYYSFRNSGCLRVYSSFDGFYWGVPSYGASLLADWPTLELLHSLMIPFGATGIHCSL